MGQQNFLGRYPFHFHYGRRRPGEITSPTTASGARTGACAVIHRTDNAVVSRNVAYDVFGHCYYLEDGVEMSNELSFNLAARIKILGPTDAPRSTS